MAARMLSFGRYSCVMRMQRARSRQMGSSIACQLGEAGMMRPFVCDCGGVDARTAVSGCLWVRRGGLRIRHLRLLFFRVADKVIQRHLADWIALRTQSGQLCQKGGLLSCGQHASVLGGNAVVTRRSLYIKAAAAEIAVFPACRIAHGQFYAAAVQKNIVGYNGNG